jgi:hypothetical protein
MEEDCMEEEKQSSGVGSFLLSVVIAVIVILVFAGVVILIVDWNTAYQYGTLVILGGLISIVFGLFSVAGAMRITRSYTYQSAEMAGPDTIYDRTKESRRNLAETYQSLIVLGSAGVIAVIIGLIIRAVGG